MLWSPSSDRLLMPTYDFAFQRFKDTDIQILDPATFAVTNLTDDGVDAGLLSRGVAANLDIGGKWLDEDTIIFVRYTIPVEGLPERGGPWLMTIDTTGGEPRKVSKALGAKGLPAYAIAVSSDGTQVAYALDGRPEDGKVTGIYVVDFGAATPTRISAMSDLALRPVGLDFSADGKYLLVTGPDSAGSAAQVIDLVTGAVVPIAAGQVVMGAAWSPTGSALAYITYDREKPATPGGLFLSNSPGKPGRLLVGGAFMTPICCGNQPFTWAANNTMIISRLEDAASSVLYVRLGQ